MLVQELLVLCKRLAALGSSSRISGPFQQGNVPLNDPHVDSDSQKQEMNLTDNRLALTQAAAVAKPTLPGTSEPAPTTPAQPVSQPSTVAPATTTKARPSQSTSPTKVDPSSSDPTGQTSSEGEDTAPLKSPDASSSVANVSPLPDKPQTTAEGDDLAPAKTTAPHDGGNGDPSSPIETEQPNLLPNPSPTVENGQVPSQGGDSGPSSSANLAAIILQGLGIIASSAKALPVPGGQSVSQVEASAPTSIAVFRNGNSIVIAGATIAPGQTTEVNGQAVSILSAGSGFVLGGTTIPLEEGQQTDISAMSSPAAATSNNRISGPRDCKRNGSRGCCC
jgi:hypothetical protein